MKAETPTRTIVPASSGRPFTSAPNSVFAQGQPAKKTRARAEPPDLTKLQIRKGVPVPPIAQGPGASSVYKELLASMKKGDSVVLNERQARSLQSCAKKAGIKVAVRREADDSFGVWRQS